MSLVHDDHVLQAFTAEAPDEPLHVGVLPWTAGAITTSWIRMCRTRCQK
jgi:hypothetical protein